MRYLDFTGLICNVLYTPYLFITNSMERFVINGSTYNQMIRCMMSIIHELRRLVIENLKAELLHIYQVEYSQTCRRRPLLGPLKKWSSWTGGRLIKHLYKTTTNQIWSFLAGF